MNVRAVLKSVVYFIYQIRIKNFYEFYDLNYDLNYEFYDLNYDIELKIQGRLTVQENWR